MTGQTLTVSNWAGYYPEDLAAQVEAANGTPVTIANHATNEEIMAKLTAGGDSGIDVAFVSGQYAQALNDAGLLEPIDAELIPNLANLYPEATQLAYDPGNKFSVPYTWGTTGICYRTDLVDAAPTSWNDILATRRRTARARSRMMTTERWLALPALKSLGYSHQHHRRRAARRGQGPADREPRTTCSPTTTPPSTSRWCRARPTLVEAWDGWCNYGTAENPDIKFMVPKEGSDLWADTMVDPEVLAEQGGRARLHQLHPRSRPTTRWVAENILYKVPNKAAMEQVGAELAAKPPEHGHDARPTCSRARPSSTSARTAPKYTDLATEVTAS